MISTVFCCGLLVTGIYIKSPLIKGSYNIRGLELTLHIKGTKHAKIFARFTHQEA